MGSEKPVHFVAFSIPTHINVTVVDKHVECRQNLPDGLYWRRRVLVPAQIHHNPRHVAQERDWDFRVDEAEQGLDDAEPDDVVTQVRTVANYVAQGPNSLLAHILQKSSFKQVVSFAFRNLRCVRSAMKYTLSIGHKDNMT